MATANIRFSQGMANPPAGEALLGVVAVPVTASNENNSGVTVWRWSIISVPSASAVPIGIQSTTPTLTFTPDVVGGYLVELVIRDSTNRVQRTRLAVVIPEVNSGLFIPPFEADSRSLTVAGQLKGWAALSFMEGWLKALDTLIGGGGGGGGRSFTFPGDADYGVLPTDDIIEWPTLTAQRTATLPAVPVANQSVTLKVNDLAGFSLVADGNGNAVDNPGGPPFLNAQLWTSYMSYTFVFNGTKWSLV